jgi:restriction endonuclease S subunit
MGSEWPTVSVAELASDRRNALVGGPFGSNLVSADYVADGVPVIRGENMGGRWVDGPFAFVTPTKADSLAANLARPGDLVFTQRGTVGQVSLVPPGPYEQYLVSQSQMKLTVDERIADPLFLYYVFQSDLYRTYFRQHAIQTGVPHTNLSILRETAVHLPPVAVQREIAGVLGALDDKVELNRRMSQTLESIARALFKSWFVDFDPVHAKAEGRDGGLGLGQLDMFPDTLQDCRLGEIPRGWAVCPLSDTVEVVGGGTPQTSRSDYWGGEIPWFSVVDAPVPSDVWTIATERSITPDGLRGSAARLLPVGTTIISARGTVGRVALVGVPMAMNQSCYGLQPRLSRRGFFSYFSTRHVVGDLARRAHGSVFDTITRETLASVLVVVPPTRLVEAFDDAVAPILERVRVGRFESRNLAQMRDAFLGELITGRSRPPDLAIGRLLP